MEENKKLSNNPQDAMNNQISTDYGTYAKFMSGITAYYIETKSKYDPMTIFLSSKIDLVPYQLYDFNRLIQEERTNGNMRALIAYETGLGKTILVGMIIKELFTRQTSSHEGLNLAPRILIVTPPTVLPQFKDEMKKKFGLEFSELDNQTVCFPNLLIASMDTLKLKEWMERLNEQPWDLVVVDEFHRVSPYNQRGDLIELLTRKTKHFIALTATPHDGKSDRYAFRLKAIASSPLVIRRTKKEALDVNNKKIFDQILHEEKVEFPVTAQETEFYRDAERYAKERYKGSGAGALVAVVIGRAVSSSIRAGVKLLKRRQNRLLLGNLDPISREDFEDLSEKVKEGGELSHDDIEKILSAMPENREELEKELSLLKPVIEQGMQTIVNNPIDSKGRRLLQIIKDVTAENRKMLIFTGFIETVNYLKEILATNGYDPIETITGGVDMEERNRIVKKLSDNPKFKVVIGTDAMGESLNLQAASVEINYEVPWSPVSYIQRVGRIWRLKQQQKDLYIHNFLPAFKIERRVMEVVLQKIKTINEEFGEVGLSVFGRELGSVDSLLRDAYAGQEVDTKIGNAFDKSVEIGKQVMEVLNKSMSLPSVVNIGELQRANIVNIDETFSEDDMRRFLNYLKDAGVASGVFPEEKKRQSTYHICHNGTFTKVSNLSLEDEGIKTAITVGMELLKETKKPKFNYHKEMNGSIHLIEITINNKTTCRELVLISSDGILTYPGIMSLAPDFTTSLSKVSFMPIEEYKQKLGKRCLEKEISIWEDSRQLKWDLLIKEKDDYKKAWLRNDLESWVNQKPTTFEAIQSKPLSTVTFVGSETEEGWMAYYEVEQAAMEKATEYYVSHAYNVADISRENRGYDLECSRTDGILRVEVKGLKGAKYPELTQNEHRMAKFYRGSFILFIVEIGDPTKEFAVPDPTANLKVEEIMKPIYRMSKYDQYQV